MSDFVTDMTRLLRLGKKLIDGELSTGAIIDEAMRGAGNAEPLKCSITPGCCEPAGHDGGCLIEATVTEEPSAPGDGDAA